MERTIPWSARRGLVTGLIAGAVLLVVEMMVALVAGAGVLSPVRMAGSVLLGQRAFTSMPGAAVVLGLLFHFGFSALLGLAYFLISTKVSPEGRVSEARQAAVGMLFGLGLWLVNFQVIARLLYPWFLEAPQFAQLLLHALFFGLPLGLLTVAEWRRRARQSALAPPHPERTVP